MWKNIGKGGIWFAIYFGLQNIFAAVFAFIYTIMNIGNLPDTADIDAVINFIMQVTLDTVVPAFIISSLCMVLIYVLHHRRTKQPLDIKSVDWKGLMFFAGVGCMTNIAISLVLNGIYSIMPESWVALLEQFTGTVSTGQPFVLLLLGTGILVPIMEEITFRYGIHRNIAKHSVVWAYIISALIFGLVHGNPIQMMYAAVIGILLSFVYQKTNNLWYPIIIHIAINSSSLFGTFFESEVAFFLTIAGIGVALIAVACIAKACTGKSAKAK